MNPSQIRTLYDAMTKGGFNLLEMSTPFSRLRLFVPMQNKVFEQPSPSESEPSPVPTVIKRTEVISERVGIFSFKAPLEPGVVLKKGQILGIIKGISIQDQVIAPCNGKITAVHIRNGEIVEFGKLLFTIEADEKILR